MLNVRRKKRGFRLLILCISAREVTGRDRERGGARYAVVMAALRSRQRRTELSSPADGDSSLRAKFPPTLSLRITEAALSCSREHIHDARSPQLEGGRGLHRRRRHRALRGRPLGQGLLLDLAGGPRARPPDEGSGPRHRSEAADRSPDAARHSAAGPDPLPRHPAAPASATSTTRSRPPSPSTSTRAATSASTRSRSTSSGRSSRKCSTSAAVRLRPRGRLQAGAAGGDGAWPTTTRRSSATASRTPSSSRWRCWPRRSGRNVIPVVEKYTELELILEVRREGRRPAADRHARQAGGARRRALAGARAATARSSA